NQPYRPPAGVYKPQPHLDPHIDHYQFALNVKAEVAFYNKVALKLPQDPLAALKALHHPNSEAREHTYWAGAPQERSQLTEMALAKLSQQALTTKDPAALRDALLQTKKQFFGHELPVEWKAKFEALERTLELRELAGMLKGTTDLAGRGEWAE